MIQVQLRLGELQGLLTDGALAFPILTATNTTPRLTLVHENGGDLVFGPGEYLIELRLRAIEGILSPWLHHVQMIETTPGVWRAAIRLEHSASSISCELPGASVFIFAAASVATEESSAGALTIGGALTTLGRALFRRAPRGLRAKLLASSRRASWLSRHRGTPDSGAAGLYGGRINSAAPSDAVNLRMDFENRFAVARGFASRGDDDATIVTSPDSDVTLVAFYLPQFHPIPENDSWWGKGFTEWTNVSKAAPQFVGHHQPKLPGELGFYDLRTPGVLAQQAALARAYGVSAFCFHYYWFEGKRLLEAPLNAFLANPDINMSYCLCWANENWTRRWDGDESEVLIAQRHTLEDHERVFEDMARYIDDKRYLRVDGKPILVVYRPDIIPNATDMTTLWREAARRRGLGEIFLAATTAFRFDQPARLGFDALVEFPPHGIVADRVNDVRWLNREHTGAVFDYAAVANHEARRMAAAQPSNQPVFPGVMPGWDNEARRPGGGTIYRGATREAYGTWLRAAVARARRTLPPDERLVFVNAWNEWAEGAYLEPDRANGRAFLDETLKALAPEK